MHDKVKRHVAGSSEGRRRSRAFTKARGFACAAVFVLVAASLLWHIGGGTLSALGVGSLSVVCPVGVLEAMLGSKTILLHPLLLLGLTVALTLVFGKAFCAWLCPTPRLQRFLRPEKKSKESPCGSELANGSPAVSGAGSPCGSCRACNRLAPVGGKRDGFQLDSRHGVLLGALTSAVVFGFPVFCLVCPIGLTFATFIGIWHLLQFNETTLGLLVFPAVLLVELVFLRKWCHRLCPVSALLSLVSSGNRSFKPQVDEGLCLRGKGIDCRICVEACPEEVDPHSRFIPECSKCGECIERCPVQAISMPFAPGAKKQALDAPSAGDEVAVEL